MDLKELEQTAKSLLAILRAQARRPFVLELTGTPKAGKSTVIGLLEGFFGATGYKVHVLRERAASCPLPMKGHFFFNTWTTATMIAELLEVVDTECDIVVLDRGFFDALIWLERQQKLDQVTEDERRVFEQFVLIERWRSLVDETIVLRVDPETAMTREHGGQLVERTGSLMNLDALEQFNDCLQAAREKHGKVFELEEMDAGEEGARLVATRVLERVLPRLQGWCDPEIACVPRSAVAQVLGEKPTHPWSDETWAALASQARFVRRSDAEPDDGLIQLVAGGIARRQDGVFVFERSSRDNHHKQYGGAVIWRGVHVERPKGGDLVDAGTLKEILRQRFKDDLHLALPLEPEPSPLGLVWDPSPESPDEGRHLGLMLSISISNDATAAHLEGKTFKTRGRRHPLSCKFLAPSDLIAREDELDLERWSRAILSEGWLSRTP